MQLYGYFRSSAAFRVRIALNLKNIDFETSFINLMNGEQTGAAYRTVNPQGRVPSLVIDGNLLNQSVAIMEYLEETHPEPAFLPADAMGRARVRGLANIISCDMHPLNNSSVLAYLGKDLGVSKSDVKRWYHHWVKLGFDAIEAMLDGHSATGRFCHGDTPGLADICLVPQVFNARRFECPLDGYPILMRVFDECMKIDSFDRAQPSKQPDAV